MRPLLAGVLIATVFAGACAGAAPQRAASPPANPPIENEQQPIRQGVPAAPAGTPDSQSNEPRPAPPRETNCSPAYATVCIPPPPPDLDCKDLRYETLPVVAPDPHRFDVDGDGLGCDKPDILLGARSFLVRSIGQRA